MFLLENLARKGLSFVVANSYHVYRAYIFLVSLTPFY